jgi:hypothetical protein
VSWPRSTPPAPPGPTTGRPGASTASWLRLSHAAASAVARTARAVVPRPLTATAQALTRGSSRSPTPAALAHGTRDLPAQVVAEAEPTLVAAAWRLDPPRLRRLVEHLRHPLDPDAADAHAHHHHQRRGLWTATTWEDMVALQGLLDPEAGQTCWPPWRPGPPPQRRRPSQWGAAAR